MLWQTKINYLFLGGFRHVDSVPPTDHLPFVWNLPQIPQFSNYQLHYLKWFPPDVARLWVAFPRLQHSDKKLSTHHVSFLFLIFFFYLTTMQGIRRVGGGYPESWQALAWSLISKVFFRSTLHTSDHSHFRYPLKGLKKKLRIVSDF